MRNIFLKLFYLCVLTAPVNYVFAQQVIKTMKRLPDTGQITSYTTTFGEDNDYNFNPPFYIDNGDGTVTDTITSLMWQQTDGGEMTIENAITYCSTLSLGGYTDWRLPSCHELFSILNHDRANPAIDTIYFTHTQAQYWWSSQRQANDSNKVWVTNSGGGVGNHPKTETISAGGVKRFHVRAVRDVTTPPTLSNHFIDNGNATTTDLMTDLMWQQVPYNDSITWEQALTLADTLSFAGYSDWRLPNIKELQSINDESLINPSINQTYFSGVNTNFYWSSTSLPNQTTKAWYLDTQFGITTYQFKTNRLYALCVRGGNVATGIKEQVSTIADIFIFPNPAGNNFTIISNVEMKNTRIEIYNALGERTFADEINGYKKIIESFLSPGVYFVKLMNRDGDKILRLLINQ